MSRLEKLAIRGIRSFNPLNEVKIEFFRPLTLIQGHNGSGKTTIIECLKMATCGALPPLSNNGKTFINDPKISDSNETKASIKLKFLTPKDKEVIVVRNFQLSIKNRKYEFKRLEQVLKSFNQNGELVTINSTCMDVDKQIPLLMHASKAIIENVIFCHQEETNWPFSEAGNLKKVFDEIFDTAKYTKALEDLKESNKSFNLKTKELKTKIELIQKDFEQYNRITHHIDMAERKIEDLSKTVVELNATYKKSSEDLEQILNLEKSYKEYENGINLAKAKKEEKRQQMETILGDPMFENYTNDEATYSSYIENYNQNNAMHEDTTTEEKIKHIENLNAQVKTLKENANQIDANIISKQQIYNNFVQNKNEMVSSLIQGDLDLEIQKETPIDEIIKILEKKEAEIKGKMTSMEETLKKFIAKKTEKENDIAVNKQLLESKVKEIEALKLQKEEFINLASNTSLNNTSLSAIESKISSKIQEINSVNYLIKQSESDVLGYENKNSQMKLKIAESSLGENSTTITRFQISKLNELFVSFENNKKEAADIFLKVNEIFQTNFSSEFEQSLDEVISFTKKKSLEITEERQKIREEKLIINIEIDNFSKNYQSKKTELSLLTQEKEGILNELRSIFSSFGITFNQDSDIENLLRSKKETENLLEEKEAQYNQRQFEIKFLEDYIQRVREKNFCDLCLRGVNQSEVEGIATQQGTRIQQLTSTVSFEYNEFIKQKALVNQLNQCSSKFNALENLLKGIQKLEKEATEIDFKIKELENKRKIFESNSREKTNILNRMNDILENSSTTEDIFKIKSERKEIEKNIISLCQGLKVTFNPLDVLETKEEIENKLTTLNQVSEIEKEISENDLQINRLNHEISSNLQLVTKLTGELKEYENEKSTYLSLSDENEIKKKLEEIDKQLSVKNNERLNLENSYNDLLKLKQDLESKKASFDKFYSEKMEKYKNTTEVISNFRIKNDYVNADFIRLISMDQKTATATDTSLNSKEKIFLEYIEELKKEKATALSKASILDKELQKLSEEAKAYEDEKKKYQLRCNIYKNNMILYKLKKDIIELDEYIKSHESKLQTGERLFYAKDLLMKKNRESLSNYNLNLGKLEELKSYLSRLNVEKMHDNYTNIEKRYSQLKLEYILASETSKQIESYYEALDQSLLKYHGKRMEEINKLINYYWGMTYKGKDIKWIEIRSDFEKTGRSRSYNYRIVFGTSGGQELDMRGRCSAGQKILVSIIIRLALAETFCNNCGILCLDEPTTNLDKDHSNALAKSLRDIIQSRNNDQNFQLIVITHDPDFVDAIGNDYCDSFWKVSKDSSNYSVVELKPINNIFNN